MPSQSQRVDPQWTGAAGAILHRDQVQPEWLDYNGHMNVAYYALVFDRATDVFLNHIGLGSGYVGTAGGSTFALEAHTVYLREVHLHDPLVVATQLVDFDSKRVHYVHRLFHADKGYLAATLEQLSMHVDLATRRGAPMPEQVLRRVEALAAAQAGLERPQQLGRHVAIRRR